MSSRGALDLLANYVYDDESSEDDIIPGPKVSTKRCHKSDSDDESHMTKLRLPVPKQFQQQKVEHNDSQNHEGRIRSFPHERGNWATFVYVPFSSNSSLYELLQTLKLHITELDINFMQDYHISLTKTVILKYHWITPFTSGIAEQVKSMRRFIVMFEGLKIYCNEEKTRTFIGLEIKTGYDSLEHLTKILDNCLEEYNLDTFYKDPSFHMSIAWTLGDQREKLSNRLLQLNNLCRNIINNSEPSHWFINVDSVQCKTGNKYYKFTF